MPPLACEISVPSTAEQEIGNVEKCLAAGFDEVVLLCLHRGTLGKVLKAVESRVGDKDRERLHLMSPEKFFTFLHSPEPAAKETTVSGYSVKVNYRPAAGEAASRKSKAVSEVLLESLKRMKNDS